MKKILIFLILFLPLNIFAQSNIIDLNQIDADLLNGQLSTYYLDTSSLAQRKSGQLTLSDSLLISILATNDTKVLSPTSTGGTTTLATEDASGIVFSTLTANTLEANGTIDGYQSDGTTSLYYHEHNIAALSASPGASGATLTAPTSNTLGG